MSPRLSWKIRSPLLHFHSMGALLTRPNKVRLHFEPPNNPIILSGLSLLLLQLPSKLYSNPRHAGSLFCQISEQFFLLTISHETMSKTCIVCLDSLEEEPPPLPLSSNLLDHRTKTDDGLEINIKPDPDSKALEKSPAPETRLIAKLLPCLHLLHDACLTPWKERCSSCPICRQNFHMVELYKMVDGKYFPRLLVE